MAKAIEVSHQGVPSRKRSAGNDNNADIPPLKIRRRTLFPFFALPRELRDIIYSWALELETSSSRVDIHYMFDLPNFTLTVYKSEGRSSKSGRPDVRYRLPLWMPANKQFLSEAIDVFARDKIFEVQDMHTKYWSSVGKPPSQVRTRSVTRRQYAAYHNCVLLQSVRTVKPAPAMNARPGSPVSSTCEIWIPHRRAMSSFFNFRGDCTTPIPNLFLEWKYTLYNDPSYPNPNFEHPSLMEWQDRFSKVTIVTEVLDRTDRNMIDPRSKIHKHTPSENALRLSTTRENIWKLAELWARKLVGAKDDSQATCKISEEKVGSTTGHSVYNIYSRTVEAVDLKGE